MAVDTFHDSTIEVGVPPPDLRLHKSFVFRFHNAAAICYKGDMVETKPFSCFNHTWAVRLYPDATVDGNRANGDYGKVTLSLRNLTDARIRIMFYFIMRDNSGKILHFSNDGNETFQFERHGNDSEWSQDNLSPPWVQTINWDTKGTFVVELHMDVDCEYDSPKFCNVVPQNPSSQQIASYVAGGTDAEVLFGVAGDNTTHKAHRTVLKACAPDLARLCDGYDSSTPVPIAGIKPEVFTIVLRYIYGQALDVDWEEHSRDVIDAANKYGVSSLKLEAEVWHVRYFEFTVDNVVDELLYADAKTCPLLKEAAIAFITDNAREVLASNTFESVLQAGEISREVIMAMVNRQEQYGHRWDRISVNDLRLELLERGMDLDGSREMMLNRLKEAGGFDEE